MSHRYIRYNTVYTSLILIIDGEDLKSRVYENNTCIYKRRFFRIKTYFTKIKL